MTSPFKVFAPTMPALGPAPLRSRRLAPALVKFALGPAPLRSRRLAPALVMSLLLLGGAGVAQAQVSPSPLPQPTTPPGGPTTKKPDGVGEKAPTTPGTLPTTPVLPPPKSEKKRFELFKIDGYFRWRGDWFKNLHLGFNDDPNFGGAPFPRPLACSATASGAPCEEAIKTSNIRARLEPTIAVGEDATVHLQVDVLDNVVLGSTPYGAFDANIGDRPLNVPINAFSGTQIAPQAGRNYNIDSIVVKQAWAEVITPLGVLKFGRMPFHWGLGILANSGGYDPIHGTYDLDGDYGDVVDRLLFGTKIPGTEYKIAVATDWSSTAPVAAQTDVWVNRELGQPFDLDDNDDVNQWVVAVTKLDSPRQWQDIVDQGELALNYGAMFIYRTQSWDSSPNFVLGETPDPNNFVRRDAKTYIPDVWFRAAYKKLSFEFEGTAVIGSIDALSNVPGGDIGRPMDIRKFGAVGRLGYLLSGDKLKVGLEVGYASGDQWDNEAEGMTHTSNARVLVDDINDTKASAFFFDPGYYVDLILWRELFGQVTNATYVKPTFRYNLTKQIKLRAWSVLSFANRPVATPGNGSMYGVEFDADVGYQNESFFAGISYGLFLPMSAMDHPDCPAQMGQSAPGFLYGCSTDAINNVGDAGTAQTIQTRLILKF